MTEQAFRSLVVAAVCLLGLIAQRAAAEPTIVAPTEPVPIGGFADVEISGLTSPDSLAWDIEPDTRVRVSAVWGRPTDPILSIATNAAGKWTLAVAFVENGKTTLKLIPIVVGTGPAPTPTPVPPGPTPTPVPPNPEGFRVLILEETADRPSLPRSQLAVLMSQDIRTYLNAKDADCWRMLDDDLTSQHMTGWTQGWKDAYAKAKELSNGRLPFIMVTNAMSGEAKPLPATVEETLALLRRFGG